MLVGSLLMGNVQSLKEQCSTGKSGSFFYYTADSRFMLKTIHYGEYLRLKHILKQYYEHVVKYPQTLITRFFGLHKIKYKPDGAVSYQRYYFIIMANVFNTRRPIGVRYDLKGSKQGRLTRKSPDQQIDPEVALKDLDWDNAKERICVDDTVKAALIKQMELDVTFFKQAEVIDYSLLIGMCELPGGAAEGRQLIEAHDNNEENYPLQEKIDQVLSNEYGDLLVAAGDRHEFQFYESLEGGILSKDGKRLYFLGIIDILTHYGGRKMIEYYGKYLVHGTAMSVAPPRNYGDRFLDYMKSAF